MYKLLKINISVIINLINKVIASIGKRAIGLIVTLLLLLFLALALAIVLLALAFILVLL